MKEKKETRNVEKKRKQLLATASEGKYWGFMRKKKKSFRASCSSRNQREEITPGP